MRKRTILILLIISTIVSITYILLSYFGLTRFLMLHIYNPNNYIESYSKLAKADKNNKTKIVLQSDKENINKIKPFLNSILDQTCKVDDIIIVLPDKNINTPNYLSKFSTIVEGTGISNTVKKQKNANTLLILLKDNIIYGKDFIEKIVQKSIESNNHVQGKYSTLYQIKKINSENLGDETQKADKFSYSENFKRF